MSKRVEAKPDKKGINPMIAGIGAPGLKSFHEKPISSAYPVIDTDLARDNLENDTPAADLEDI